MSSDPRHLELSPPLPDGAQRAHITFLRLSPGRGLEPVPRSRATHAEIEITGRDGEARSQRVELAAALTYLADVERRHSRLARREAGGAELGVRASAERAERAAGLRVDCPHCGAPRHYEGARSVVSVVAGEAVATADYPSTARPETRTYHEYACPRCGSVELFRAGPLDHPLPLSGSEPL